MKKYILISIFSIVLFQLVGCTSSGISLLDKSTTEIAEAREKEHDNNITYKDGENLKLISKNGIDFIVNGKNTINISDGNIEIADGINAGNINVDNSLSINNVNVKDTFATKPELVGLFKKHIMYVTIPMNDQAYQPFRGQGDNFNRRLYPMWTDIDISIMDKTEDSQNAVEHTINLATYIDNTLLTNAVGYSVEIPAVYRGTPDSRWNRRLDYTKYTSIGQFLYMNAEEDVYENYNDAKLAWNNTINHPSEAGALQDKILYAPRFFIIKIDFSKLDPSFAEWAHSRNNNLCVMFNRSIAGKVFETDPNDPSGLRKIWTPVIPRWGYDPMTINAFITGDLANPEENE